MATSQGLEIFAFQGYAVLHAIWFLGLGCSFSLGVSWRYLKTLIAAVRTVGLLDG